MGKAVDSLHWPPVSAAGVLSVQRLGNLNWCVQEYRITSGIHNGRRWYRSNWNNGTWSAWQEVASMATSINNTNSQQSANFNISGKGVIGATLGVGAATVPSGYKLAVAGKVIAEEVRVKLQSAGWPDYVFNPNYKLMPLEKVEQFIKTNGHLPEVPSAKEVEKNGVEVGASQALLLKKIEELTLYSIQQQKQIEGLQSELQKIRTKLK